MNVHKQKYAYAIFLIAILFFTVTGSVSATDTYALDPAHTSVTFKVKHLGVTNVHGRFNDVSGTIVLDEANPGNNSVVIRVKTDSVDTANAKRDNHLRSPDFFDAKTFPVIEFKSTSLKKVNAETYEVRGNVSLHGVTRPLNVSAEMTGAGKDPWGNYRIGFETAFKVKRTDFGMTKMLQAAGDVVRLSVNVEGIRK